MAPGGGGPVYRRLTCRPVQGCPASAELGWGRHTKPTAHRQGLLGDLPDSAGLGLSVCWDLGCPEQAEERGRVGEQSRSKHLSPSWEGLHIGGTKHGGRTDHREPSVCRQGVTGSSLGQLWSSGVTQAPQEKAEIGEQCWADRSRAVAGGMVPQVGLPIRTENHGTTAGDTDGQAHAARPHAPGAAAWGVRRSMLSVAQDRATRARDSTLVGGGTSSTQALPTKTPCSSKHRDLPRSRVDRVGGGSRQGWVSCWGNELKLGSVQPTAGSRQLAGLKHVRRGPPCVACG